MAPVDTFWTSNVAPSGKIGVMDHNTPASARVGLPGQPPPYMLLDVTRTATELNPQIALDAAALFPVFDALSPVPVSRPANFALPPSGAGSLPPGEFVGWHTAHQIAYIREHATAVTVNDGGGALSYLAVTIGTAAAPRENISAILSQDGQSVIVLNALTRTDIAKLPLADQRALAVHPQFSPLIAEPFSLEPTAAQLATPGTTTSTVRDEIKQSVQNQIEAILGLAGYEATTAADGTVSLTAAGLAAAAAAETAFNAAGIDSPERKQNYPFFFTQQLVILRDSLDGMAVFDRIGVEKELSLILERFQRLNRFATITDAPLRGDTPLNALNSLDFNATIANGLSVFLRVESQLHELSLLEWRIAQTGQMPVDVKEPKSLQALVGRKLDTPTLTFVLQSIANYRIELRAEAETEELNQQTRLLQDYTAMQRWLNATLSRYDPEKLSDQDDVEKLPIGGRTFFGVTLDPSTFTIVPALTYGELYSPPAPPVTTPPTPPYFQNLNPDVISMFDTGAASANNNTFHPLEVLRGVIRPTADFLGGATSTDSFLPAYPKTIFDSFAVNIAESTKILNQENQIRMDGVNTLNKQKNRHYDLGSNTLNKMTEMLRSIIS